MSLSPFDSFQSRFVTYLLNFLRTLNMQIKSTLQDDHSLRKVIDPFHITFR